MEIELIYQIYRQHPVVTTDSRNCPSGALFFALKGASFNGNAFAAKALEAGCAYAVVDEAEYVEAGNDRYILVDDSLKCLQQLANYHRRQLAGKGLCVLAITGTNGKTTTKELVSAVLAKQYNVLYTQGNLNNHIGVPLTLLRLTEEHDIAIVEMGANHPGEIDFLARIAEPDYGLITNVGKAHLEGFGSFEGVIRTKGELYDYLRTKQESVVFINNDNPYLNEIALRGGGAIEYLRYGRHIPDNGMRLTACGEILECAPYLSFRWCGGVSALSESDKEWHTVHTRLIGSYNLDNMLAAVTIGLYFEVTPQLIDEALSEYVPQNNRSQWKETAHNHLIVDAYNANPTSMMAALTNFRDMKVAPKMVILGDMKELGEGSLEEHRKVVDFLVTCGFEQVWLVGKEFAATETAFRQFVDVEEVKATVAAEKPEGYAILVKGSNSMKLSQLADCL